jgi:hypothetical protein
MLYCVRRPPQPGLTNGRIPATRASPPRPLIKNGGTLEKASAMANHASTRTTQLYDRRHDEMSLDEVERVVI